MLRASAARRLCTVASRAAAANDVLMATRARAPLTKLVTTIGPASEEAEPLAACVAAGLDVMRVNFSHATREEFHLRQRNLRATPGGELCAIMLDTKGPEIRMGGLAVCEGGKQRKAKILLETGEQIKLTTDPAFDGSSDASTLYIGYPGLASKVAPGQRVLLDDGLVTLEVVEATDAGVRCIVLNTSQIGERKGVNLPGVITGLPPLSDKDREDIRFGVEHDIDMVRRSRLAPSALPTPACSPARSALAGRRLVRAQRGGRGSDPRVPRRVPRALRGAGDAAAAHHLEGRVDRGGRPQRIASQRIASCRVA
jgi:hypothetical protein